MEKIIKATVTQRDSFEPIIFKQNDQEPITLSDNTFVYAAKRLVDEGWNAVDTPLNVVSTYPKEYHLQKPLHEVWEYGRLMEHAFHFSFTTSMGNVRKFDMGLATVLDFLALEAWEPHLYGSDTYIMRRKKWVE